MSEMTTASHVMGKRRRERVLLICVMLSYAEVTSAADQNEELFKAAQGGDVARVRSLLESGAPPDSLHGRWNDRTPLHAASERGHLEVVDALIRAGADVDRKDGRGETATTLARKKRHDKVAARLEEAARLLRDLEAAVDNGDERAVESLLTAGARAEMRHVLKAGARGHLSVAKALLARGANPGGDDLAAAAKDGHVQLAAALLEVKPLLLKSDWRVSWAIVDASGRGHTEFLRMVLEKGADPNVYGSNEWTPLMAAAMNGHAEVVKLLLAAGADPNATTVKQTTSMSLSFDNRGNLLPGSGTSTEQSWPGLTAAALAREKAHTVVAEALEAAAAQARAAEATAATLADSQAAKTYARRRLLWTTMDNGRGLSDPEAQSYCQNLNLAGLAGWRLPSMNELKGLRDPESDQRHKIVRPFRISSCCIRSDDPYQKLDFTTGLRMRERFRSSAGEDSFGGPDVWGAAPVLCVRQATSP